jgi:hypothetical protein
MAELQLGVLAESDSDCEVIRVVVRRIFEAKSDKPGSWRVHKRAGKGCAKLRQRAGRWLVELAESGCTAAVVVHDLDRNPANGSLNDVALLERELAAIPVPRKLKRLICIPIEEIEAWFFASEKALEKACGKPHKPHASPHLIARPKERLIDLSRGFNKRPRYSENDNPKLAEELDLAECTRRCPAFGALHEFVLGLR